MNLLQSFDNNKTSNSPVEQDDLSTLLARVNRLERRNRFQKWFAIALAILLVASGALQRKDDRLDVSELTLRDGKGVKRAWLGLDFEGLARLELCDDKGNRRVGLTLRPDGTAGIDALDKLGTERMFLGVGPDENVSLSMYQSKQNQHQRSLRPGLGAGIEKDGTVGISVLGLDGRNLRVMSRPGGEAAFTAFNPELHDYASMGFAHDARMHVTMKQDKKTLYRVVTYD